MHVQSNMLQAILFNKNNSDKRMEPEMKFFPL